MALTTSARIGVGLGIGQLSSSNRSNVGFDRGMLKGYAERLMDTERRRLIVRDFSGAKRPWIFLNPSNQPKKQGVTKRKVSRLRRLESRNYWWQNLRHSVRMAYLRLESMTPFRSYHSQLRYGLR